LGEGVTDTDTVQDQIEVVGYETVSRPLREEADSDDDKQPLPVPLGRQDRSVRCRVLGLPLDLEGILDLLILVCDERVVDVPVGVPFGEDTDRLLVSPLVAQPSRRLGAEEDEAHLDEGR